MDEPRGRPSATRPPNGRPTRRRSRAGAADWTRADPAAARHPQRPRLDTSAPGTHDTVEVLIHVRLAPTATPAAFTGYLRTEPGILHAWRIAGDIDFEVHLRCQGISDLHALLGRARRLGGAQDTTTHLILNPTTDRPQRPDSPTER